MRINVIDPFFQTVVFSVILFVLLILSIKRKKAPLTFSKEVTEELKGFAILAVIFSHIGYFLSTDNRFLFPLSILAGVGVNLFLFLSGLGLTVSALQSPASIAGFYSKRLKKLFVPMWITITVFIGMDFLIKHQGYPVNLLIQNYFGIFPQADLFLDLNSPLWYFTMILFYYLIFPIFFWRKVPYISPFVMLIFTFLLLKLELPVNSSVEAFYKLHFMSFPIGVFFAELLYHEHFNSIKTAVKDIFLKFNLKYITVPFFAVVFLYTSFNSGVGLSKVIEQTISLITMFSVIFIFVVKNVRFSLLSILGKYSYEIYLIHWPLLARYGVLYAFLPAFLATQMYLGVFIGVGWVMQKINTKIG